MRKSTPVLMTALTLFLGGAVGTAPAKAKKDAPLSKLFCHARYAYVRTYEGDPDANAAREYPQDYDAAIAVQQRIQRWGRYTLVYEQKSAELVFAVWTERKEGNRLPGQPTGMPPMSGPRVPDPGTGGPGGSSPGSYPGGPISGGPGQNPGGIDGPDGAGGSRSGGGRPLGAEIVPPGDLLAVYTPSGDETLSSPIWKKSEDGGLQPPMHLFAELADAVDDACSDPGTKSH
jgi:hypothetical protein